MKTDFSELINFIAFDGPDCCGKTTAISNIARKLDNCIIFKFPPKNEKTNKIFDEMMKNVYNLKCTCDINDIDLNKALYTMEINSLYNFNLQNCAINKLYKELVIADDKTKYFKDVYNNMNTTYDIKYNLPNTLLPVDIFIEGKSIGEIQNVNKVVKLCMEKICGNGEISENSSKINVIFDRFILSSDCYNRFLPLTKLLTMNITDKTKLARILNWKIQNSCNNRLTCSINNFHSITCLIEHEISGKHFKNVIFKSSNFIKSNSNRADNDEYDKDRFIQETVESYFDNFGPTYPVQPGNCIIIDTDKIYLGECLNCLENVSENTVKENVMKTVESKILSFINE